MSHFTCIVARTVDNIGIQLDSSIKLVRRCVPVYFSLRRLDVLILKVQLFFRPRIFSENIFVQLQAVLSYNVIHLSLLHSFISLAYD